MACAMNISFIILFTLCAVSHSKTTLEEDKYGVKYATPCEVCKLVTKEINERLEDNESSGVIETGYNMDLKKKKTKYNKSELRLVEVLEGVCSGMEDYRVHKERLDSTRWAKIMSQTFRTLHGLVNKGVKVELGIPYELWDEPSAEVTQLKTQCEQFIEAEEDAISDWYFSQSQSVGLQQTLCPTTLTDSSCLLEPYGEDVESPTPPESSGDPRKGDKSSHRSDL